MQYLEIIGTLVGLLYLYFEYKASIWLWLAGVVMPAIYIFVYYSAGFYADMGINVYYLVASAYGWAMWLRKGSRTECVEAVRETDDSHADESARKEAQGALERPIATTPRRAWLPLLLVFLVFFVLIAWILIRYTDSTVPYGDSFTTALSIVGLWMLAQKYVEQWLVWVAVDVVCAGLYFFKGLYPTAVLYTLYSVIAIFGYFKWLKMMKQQGKYDTIAN